MNKQAQPVDAVSVVETVPASFPSVEEIELLWRIGLFSADDERALRKLWRILQGQADDYLDRVLGMVAAYPALADALAVLHNGTAGNVMESCPPLRQIFQRWLSETCLSPHESLWLRQLYAELPLNPSAQALITRLPDFRYLIALSFPLLATANTLLIDHGLSPQDIERMQSAFLKAILLQVTLLSKLYVKEGLW